jgi:hypothetical protein
MNTTEGFEGYLDWGKARGKDFQAVAQIVYLAVNGTSPKKAYPSSQRIETFLSSTDGTPSSTKSSIVNTMDIFCRIAKTPSIDEPLTTNLSPLEFVMAAFLIFQQRTSLTDRQLSDAICKMREHAKRRTEDLKFSQPNFKVCLDFVLRNVPKLFNPLVTPEASEKPAACMPYRRRESMVDRFKYNVNLETESDSRVDKSAPPITRGAKASGKRKRATNDDSGDEDADWIVEAPAMKSRTMKGSQPPATKVDPLSKVANRQKDAESKARTIVKKSPQKSNHSKQTSSKFDGQVGTPSIRPTPSMAVQQFSGSSLSQSRSPTVSVPDSAPTGRPIPSRIWDFQIFKTRVSDSRTSSQEAVVDGGPPISSSSTKISGEDLSYGPRSHQRQSHAHGRLKTADNLQRPGEVTSSTIDVTRTPGSFSSKITRNPPNPGSPSPPAMQARSPAMSRHDAHSSRTPGTQRAHPSTGAGDVKQGPRNRLPPSALLKNSGTISSRRGISSPLEDR